MSKRELEEKLLDAASLGDGETVTRLLQDGADVNCRSARYYEDTPLHKAASWGHVGVAELLLKAGAQVDSMEKSKYTPLHLAASEGHVGVAELLLMAGAQVDSRDWDGSTPLHRAATEGHVGVAELLLKAGAQVDSRDKNEATPLHWAASWGHVRVAELLLKAGAQVNIRNQNGSTPLHRAASKGYVGVAELLLKAGAQLDSRDEDGNTPLHIAAKRGRDGVAEILIKAGSQVDSRNKDGKTAEDIAASGDTTSLYYFFGGKHPILVGRERILELFGTGKVGGSCWRKVGPEGGELQTSACTVSVPSGAVTMETEITCQIINPNDVTLLLKDGEMLVSDVIELGPHGRTFLKPVTVQMQHSSASLGGAMEAAVWVTEDRSKWTELETTEKTQDKVTVSVDHFSLFAVVSQPKQEQFSVSTEECTLTSSTQPAVQLSFPKQSVDIPTEVKIQVQEVPTRAVEDIKTMDQSSRGLLGTSPIVNVETVSDSAVQFHKPVTVRVPHPLHYMDIQHDGPTKLKVMSCEEGTEDWVEETDNVNIRETNSKEFVKFEVSHFTRWIVIVVTDIYDDPEELGPIPLNLCRWLQHRAVQFILLQREDNANEFVVECAPAESTEKKHAALLKKGYCGPVPTDSVDLLEGQVVEISLLGNVSIAPFSPKRQLTFHSQKHNRLHMQVLAMEAKGQHGLDGQGSAAFFALPRVEVRKEEVNKQKRRAALRRKGPERFGHPPGVDLQQPTFLCQLPMHVPYEAVEMSTEGADGGTALKGIEKYFYFIKERVSTDWGDLAMHLGFQWADLKNIAGRNPDDKTRCMDMLWSWRKREGDSATTKVLLEALSNTRLKKVVDGLKKEYPDIGTSSER